MFLSLASRCLSFPVLLVSALLTFAAIPGNAVATFEPFAFHSASPADWMRNYTPAQFRQLTAAKNPIDPANFCEPLLVAAIFQETNQQRTNLNLPSFLPDEKASNAAHQHAKWMAKTHVLSHDEPSSQGTPVTSLERLVQQGLRPHATGENIAYNLLPDITPGRLFYTRLENGRSVYSYHPGGRSLPAHTYEDFARVIVAQWMHSPPHRAHIVDPQYRFLGVGVALAHQRGSPATIYGVQDFYTPRISPQRSTIMRSEATLLPPRP